MRGNKSLLRRLASPLHGLDIILRRTLAVIVHCSQKELRVSISLVRCNLKLFISLGIITSVEGGFAVIETRMSEGSESDQYSDKKQGFEFCHFAYGFGGHMEVEYALQFASRY